MEDQDKEEPWSLRCLSGNVILNRELIVSLCKTSNFHFFCSRDKESWYRWENELRTEVANKLDDQAFRSTSKNIIVFLHCPV